MKKLKYILMTIAIVLAFYIKGNTGTNCVIHSDPEKNTRFCIPDSTGEGVLCVIIDHPGAIRCWKFTSGDEIID
ncbi:MAG TPA: hypothetical protein PKC24_07040 [Cyclobacteriaceae bacterium]|nr:hypothetical protein [Cyclobacteriaceae bacterium]